MQVLLMPPDDYLRSFLLTWYSLGYWWKLMRHVSCPGLLRESCTCSPCLNYPNFDIDHAFTYMNCSSNLQKAISKIQQP